LTAPVGVHDVEVSRASRPADEGDLLPVRRPGAVVQQARELVVFARGQGYQLAELVQIIQDVG
jgi:hypothetical protein